MTATLQVIRQEHAALAAVLRSLQLLLAAYRRHGTAPDFGLVRAMLLYVDEYPEKLHHVSEARMLFPALRARSGEAAAALDRLDAEHERGEAAIRALEHDLLAWEVLGESRRATFEHSLARYVEFYLAHMALEETEVLPLAQRVLTAEDWSAVDAAFLAHRDPLTGHAPADEFRPVFDRIVRALPAPIGLGAPLD
jgi:hemerythrin-like domain-containing protein